jgi:hypothetical protein
MEQHQSNPRITGDTPRSSESVVTLRVLEVLYTPPPEFLTRLLFPPPPPPPTSVHFPVYISEHGQISFVTPLKYYSIAGGLPLASQTPRAL